MAITSEIIGKLGGTDLEQIPVEGSASGSSGSRTVIATVDIPAGETWLVAAIGQKIGGLSADSYQPGLYLGDAEIPVKTPSGTYGLATTASGSISFGIKRVNSSGTDSFTGHVYTVKL